MSLKIYGKKDKKFINENKSDKDNISQDECDENDSSKENDEKSSLMQVLYSYEDFQKKNMNYGKMNPYKKKETQLSKVKKTIVKLFSNADIGIQEENKKKIENLKFLTSRAAMWNQVEKNEDPDYDLKLESSTKKSLIDIILNYINLLVNDFLNDKKGMTYIATFMIILSIVITCISGFVTVFNRTGTEDTNWNINTTKNHYEDLNKLMNFIKIENENNGNDLKFYELLQQFKNNMNENMNSNYMIKKENASLYELNINLENKIKEIEKKLISNTNEIDYFKANSKKEIEDFKKKLQDNYQVFQNKFKDYIKAIDTIKKNINKDDFLNDMEKKLSKNQIDIKKDVSNKVEYEKKELLETISELQKKIEWIENRISNQKLIAYENNNLSKSLKDNKESEEQFEKVEEDSEKGNENQKKQEKKKVYLLAI